MNGRGAPAVGALLLAAAAAAGAAGAAEVETLAETGRWRTDLNIHDDGRLTCESITFDARGTSFGWVSDHFGRITLQLRHDGWAYPAAGEPARYVLRVDALSPWTVPATRAGNTVATEFAADDPAAARFFAALSKGARVTIQTPARQVTAAFGLDGAAEAMRVHAECRRRIAAGAPAGPFDGGIRDRT
jgi:hypothetical protein